MPLLPTQALAGKGHVFGVAVVRRKHVLDGLIIEGIVAQGNFTRRQLSEYREKLMRNQPRSLDANIFAFRIFPGSPDYQWVSAVCNWDELYGVSEYEAELMMHLLQDYCPVAEFEVKLNSKKI